ncbi:hypothetical protein VP01_699g2 [Puccinia sorghi]|uniref:Uncharacterized protein n=1 Tax=Puccinia sorghi TaxID=27349 RepID=A0A0L6UDU6_9BASI|nr:hypothetical protein VP01_699g2 [Puccinia sorghi]
MHNINHLSTSHLVPNNPSILGTAPNLKPRRTGPVFSCPAQRGCKTRWLFQALRAIILLIPWPFILEVKFQFFHSSTPSQSTLNRSSGTTQRAMCTLHKVSLIHFKFYMVLILNRAPCNSLEYVHSSTSPLSVLCLQKLAVRPRTKATYVKLLTCILTETFSTLLKVQFPLSLVLTLFIRLIIIYPIPFWIKSYNLIIWSHCCFFCMCLSDTIYQNPLDWGRNKLCRKEESVCQIFGVSIWALCIDVQRHGRVEVKRILILSYRIKFSEKFEIANIIVCHHDFSVTFISVSLRDSIFHLHTVQKASYKTLCTRFSSKINLCLLFSSFSYS